VLPIELRPLLVLGTAALVVACLYWAQAVLVPIALAGLLAFLLTPVVDAMEKRTARRATSVLLVVVLAFSVTGVVGWIVARHIVTLADEVPQYRANIRARIAEVRGFSKGGSVEKVQQTLNEVVGEMQKAEPGKPADDKPVPVVVSPPTTIATHVPTLLDTLATAGVVTVLVIFMLLERQILRDRLVRLIGYHRVSITTRALDEATARISRYLLMQSIINGLFGVAATVALFLLGVPYAVLWGFLAFTLRFIPYVGPTLALLLPTALALAAFPGWTRPLLVVGALLALELVANMVLEPWLYGQSAGVSQVALLVAVVFWTWLWGPVGLLLATPLTVCLIVLSKHLPSMRFMVLLMGDEPVLDAKARFYQRLLARDQDEAADIVDEVMKTNAGETVYDEVLLPALSYAKRDVLAGEIDEMAARYVVQATLDIVQDIRHERVPPAQSAAAGDTGDAPGHDQLIVLCPAKDDYDAVALAMAANLLAPQHRNIEVLGTSLLSAEVSRLAEERRNAVFCVGSVTPGGLRRARYLTKRLRACCPDVGLVVGRLGAFIEPGEQQQLEDAGAQRVALSLLELRRFVDELCRLADAPPSAAEVMAPADVSGELAPDARPTEAAAMPRAASPS
jgi:predicted PurR-regulated permease PerM